MPEEDRDGGHARRKNCPTPVEGILLMNTCCASSVMFVIIEVNHDIVIASWGICAAFSLTHSSALIRAAPVALGRSGTVAHSAEAITRDAQPIR